METLKPLLQEMAIALGVTGPESAARTHVPGVHIFGATEPIPRRPLLYESGIVIVGQGHKIGHIGHESFRYDSETYLVVSVPLSFECETHASPEEPLLGISIDVSPAPLRDLIASIGDDLPLEDSIAFEFP